MAIRYISRFVFLNSFGAKIRSYKTGIVYNNHMSTFSLPNTTKTYQPKPSKANYIQPGKRSVSTACPTIVVDKIGSVRMVVGGSGGLRITSGVPTVIQKDNASFDHGQWDL